MLVARSVHLSSQLGLVFLVPASACLVVNDILGVTFLLSMIFIGTGVFVIES